MLFNYNSECLSQFLYLLCLVDITKGKFFKVYGNYYREEDKGV